ncbi:hypothetical protein BTH42_00210 [Burkholderia sp. SRS-W-2-2016]|uniref:hypothetical protein n=1 Tax=Burkholderia sp. SRS-W-2-2016 TaxID=1926878 RepID=UPI00094B2C84|nr:hypothetical protein [Burkholderia sp. SRS-W-2-2016]OLL33738.1 hypothetical protein BTH42_00210 [Burkholderia sp. SRS-W-2-2016]
MTDDLHDFLVKEGPQLSGGVALGLASWLGITPAAARKKIERRSAEVRALTIPFARRARFLYAASQYGSDRFWARLAQAFEEGNGAYSRVIRALKARGGLMPMVHLASAAGISGGPRQIPFERVWQNLVDIGLFETIEVPGLGQCFAFAKNAPYLDELLPPIRARLIAETVLLQSVQEWAAKLGLGSFNSFKLRGGLAAARPIVSVFEWDMTAPSYISALATWNKSGRPKPGFIVLDVLLKDEVDLNDLSPFIYKCRSLRQVRGVRTMQFFVAHRYTLEALDAIRREGVVPATTESLFGTDVARALMELSATLTQAATQAVEPEKFTQLFEKLGKIEGAAGTLRGALFEFVIADVMRRTVAGANITMNKIYRQDGKDVAEVDVRVVVPGQQIRFIECKGLLPGRLLSDSDVEAWLNKRIPSVRSQTLDNPEFRNLALTFELWLTGELTPEADAKIKAMQASVDPKRYAIKVLLAPEIEDTVRDLPDLHKVITQHFLRHPLAAPDEVINPVSKRQISRTAAIFADLTPSGSSPSDIEANQTAA